MEDEVRSGAVLLDVRAPTERSRDGSSALPHVWQTFGPDRWRTPTDGERAEFLAAVAERSDLRARRMLVLCSVGLRSEAATRALSAAGYDAANVGDGWLGNGRGAGLRELEQMMGE